MVLLYGELYSFPTYDFTDSTGTIKIITVERKSNMEFAWLPFCFMFYKVGQK